MIEYKLEFAQNETIENATAIQTDFRSIIQNTITEFSELLKGQSITALARNNGLAIIVKNIVFQLTKLRTNLHDALIKTTERSILDPDYAKRKIQINDKISNDYKNGVDTLTAAIDNLSKLQYSSDLNIIHILKFLSLIRVPNLKAIEFTYDYKIVNHETLLDIEYPLDLVPEDFTCKILNVVMSKPCDIPGAAIIDRVIVEKSPENPFNRQPWPDVIPILNSLQESINLFMRKVEWLYIYFQEDKKYKKAYVHNDISSWVLDSNITYVDFAKLVKGLPEDSLVSDVVGIQNPETNFVAYGLDKQPAYPAKYVYDLFLQCKMFVTPRPRNTDYEKLIRKLAAIADLDSLKLLLHSPILDLAKIDIYACNEKGENVLDLLQNYKSKYPHLKTQYDECEKILATHQEPISKDIPSWGRVFYRAADFLPSFNYATAISTTIAMMGAGVYLFSDDTNKNNRRLTL